MQSFSFGGKAPEVLLFSGDDVRQLLSWSAAVNAVEAAFGALGRGEAPPPGILGFHVDNGGFHIKAGRSAQRGGYFTAKINANFPGNPARGLPTIQGVVALYHADDGRLLALLDSSELTARRTGAATGVAAKYLARRDATSLTIIGCGVQAYAQVRCVAEVRGIERVYAYDASRDVAQVFAQRLRHDLDIEAEGIDNIRAGTRVSDIVITCTPARAPVLFEADVRPGTFVAGVGADHPEKHELDAALLRRAMLVTDLTEQCRTIGDLHHAEAQVAAELGDVVAGNVQVTPSPESIVVFDSTGIALQDVFAAVHVYEAAIR
jgi:alanine dehydrogenase